VAHAADTAARRNEEKSVKSLPARDRLIVALDVPAVSEARALIDALGPEVTFYKIGLELVMNGGLDLARELARSGRKVFLDMKLLDIGNTVERAARNAASTGATFLTVHGHDRKTLSAALAGTAGTQLKVLAVTVLTNLDAADLREQGLGMEPDTAVVHRAKLANAAGCGGVVASALEAARVREVVGPGMSIVTPGIRLPGDAAGDQSRVATPQVAIAAGADYIVAGRPVIAAPDPRAAARDFIQSIEEGLSLRSFGAG
jgi:orotidine-5'-phosphate decarboxylase